MIGRGLRTVDPNEHPGVTKSDCIVLDFGTSTFREPFQAMGIFKTASYDLPCRRFGNHRKLVLPISIRTTDIDGLPGATSGTAERQNWRYIIKLIAEKLRDTTLYCWTYSV